MAFWSGLRRLGRNRHYNRGIVHYNKGEYAEAVHAFEEALASIGDTQDPDYSLGVFYAAEARGNLALAHLRSGDLGAAEQELRRALDSNPDYADLRYHLAALLERGGRIEEALAECQHALELSPDFLEARLLAAVCADRLGKPEAAKQSLERARSQGFELPDELEMDPWTGLSTEARECLRHAGAKRSQAQQWLEKALDRYTQGDRVGAIADLSRAVEAEPKFPDLRARLAGLLAEAGRHEEAIDELSRALEINPKYLEARVRRGISYLSLGRAADARNDFAEALTLKADYPDLLYFRAAAEFQAGDSASAAATLESALHKNPRFARARRLLSLCLVALDRDVEALEQFRKSLGDNREAPRAWMDMAWLALRMGDADRAVKDLERACVRLPEYPDVHYGLGVALIAAGRVREAEQALQRALEIAPDYGLARYRLGGAQLNRGAASEAREQLEQAVRGVPEYADAWLALARARRACGDEPNAQAACERALEINPGFAEARAERASLLAASGREAEAKREWKAVLRLDPLHPLARAHAGGLGEEAMEEGYAG